MTFDPTPRHSALDPETLALALALADDELVIGHRHSEWLGLSPFLEEDLATASIAQDEMGHARAVYAIIWPDWLERDALVTLRRPDMWRSCGLVEADARPWEHHLVRHLVYDLVEGHRWGALAARRPGEFTALAERACTEERWHRRHATELVQRLAVRDSPRLQGQLDSIWPLVGALFDGFDESEHAAAEADLTTTLESVGLHAPAAPFARADRTRRTPAFTDIHRSFTEVAALDPSATW